MTEPWNLLVEHWRSQGLPIVAGCSESNLALAELRWGSKLPGDFRDYLARLNGMNPTWPGDQDAEGYSFWPLDRLRTLPEETRHYDSTEWSQFPDASRYVLFADYMCWCWALAILLDETSPGHGSIHVIGHAVPVQIAASFSDFVALYIADSDELYPHAP